MPQVPIYNGPQVRETALDGGFQRTTNAGAVLADTGKALTTLAAGVDAIAYRQDLALANQAEAKITQDWLKWDSEARAKYRGQNVDQYEAEANKWWQDTRKTYAQSLNPRSRAIADSALTTRRTQAMSSVLGYSAQERDRFADESAVAVKSNEVQFAISTGTEPALVAARTKIQETNAQIGARKGWTPEQLSQQNLKDTSDMHVAYLLNLSKRDPAAAQAYFTANRQEIVPSAQGQLSERLENISAVADGDNAANDIWATNMAGKGYNAPVDLAAMETQARERFKNDSTRAKAAIDGLRQRTTAFDRSQKEFNFGNKNTVFGLLDKGQTMNQVMRSDAWQALPETEQRAIRLELQREAAALESQAAARAQRAAANASRELTLLQTNERLAFMRNGDRYLSVSDPEKLARMSRAEVQAMRTDFGMTATEHLLNKWDTLQKPGKIAEARIDKQDFEQVAQDLGLRPFDPKKSEQERAALGSLQFRVEQLIDVAQRNKGKPLTREEKMTLMRTEMSKTVTVNSNFLFPDPQVPVIQLTPDQAKQVVVPATDRTQIIEALKQKYAQEPTNPAYAPTDENVRRLYLLNRSRAAGLINGQ
jgi:hypothetical protein